MTTIDGKLSAVSVIEHVNGTILKVVSYEDDTLGNCRAEKLFTQIAKENDFSNIDIEFGLSDGYLKRDDYQLFIIHSNID